MELGIRPDPATRKSTRFPSLLVTFWAPQGWPDTRGQSFCCLVSIVDEAGGYDDPSLCCCRPATPEKPPTVVGTESPYGLNQWGIVET